jgi:phage-related protein
MKRVRFIGSSLEDWRKMPERVQDELGHALHLVQIGELPSGSKLMKGMGGSILELRDDYKTDTYRAVCVLRFEEAIYVLHCFQKKSKSGIGIPKADQFIIENRLKQLIAERR